VRTISSAPLGRTIPPRKGRSRRPRASGSSLRTTWSKWSATGLIHRRPQPHGAARADAPSL